MSFVNQITSLNNPIVQAMRKLHRMAECDRRREFLVEGTHAVEEALAARWPLRSVFWTSRWAESNRHLAARLIDVESRYCVSEAILQRIATTLSPDGVMAVAKYVPRKQDLSFQLGIALVSVQDPGNMGTLVRAAVAAGADGVFASPDSVSPYHPKVIRASAGQWFRLPPQVVAWDQLIAQCRRTGTQTLAAAAEGKCFWEADFVRPTLLLLGNEGAGLSKEIVGSVEGSVAVPMQSGVESLNVAMTGTLLLYEAMRQRRQASSLSS